MNRSLEKCIFTFTVTIVLLCIMICPVKAEVYSYDGSSGKQYEEAWEDLLDTLPDEIRREMASYSITSENGNINRFLSVSYWWEKTKPVLIEAVQSSLEQLSSVIGILLLRIWLGHWTGTVSAGSFQFCGDLCMALTLFSASGKIMTRLHRFTEQLCGIMTAMLPVMTALQYSTGEVTAASVNRIGLTLFITVLNHLQRGLFLPLGQALFGISIMSCVCTKIPLSGFTGGLKKLFMTLFSMMILIYTFVYGIQDMLAGNADSLGLRTVKFAMGNLIPIVGGTVAEAFSSVYAGLSYVKLMAGTGGILILCLLVLPMVITVISFDGMLFCTHTAAELLNCSHSVRLIGSVRGILQMLSAILWLSVLFFIFTIILFTQSTGRTV